MKDYPKKIYLELTTIPACNFGCLWHEDKINNEDVPYILESEVEELKVQYNSLIKMLMEIIRGKAAEGK